jgi:putative transposase
VKALKMAVRRRCPEPGLLHHSDRGCTYTCEDHQAYLAIQDITCSMSRRADGYDNADGELLCDREEGGRRSVSELQ